MAIAVEARHFSSGGGGSGSSSDGGGVFTHLVVQSGSIISEGQQP